MKRESLVVLSCFLACAMDVKAQPAAVMTVPRHDSAAPTEFAADLAPVATSSSVASTSSVANPPPVASFYPIATPSPFMNLYPVANPGWVDGASAPRFWVSAEYLQWTLRGSPLPPLVTAASSNSTATVPGALGNPDTAILFGDQRVNDAYRPGFRVRAGYWFDDCQSCGLDGSFFSMHNAATNYSASSDGQSESLFRPIFNTITGQPGVQDVANLADGIVGQVSVQAKIQFLGGDFNFRKSCFSDDGCDRGCRIDWLAGYRVLSLNETVQINENLTTLDLAGNPNGTIAVQDRFRTRNLFQGPQLGLDGEWRNGRWFFGARAVFAVGVISQTVEIDGSTVTQAVGGSPLAQPGGLLALPTNIGNYHRDRFAISPAGGLKLGYQCTPWLRLSAGYDLTYLTNVVRPGNQIDLTVNPNQVPPAGSPPFVPARPAFALQSTDFWAHGVTFAMEFRF
jgi:hypothetical protein